MLDTSADHYSKRSRASRLASAAPMQGMKGPDLVDKKDVAGGGIAKISKSILKLPEKHSAQCIFLKKQ